MKISVIFTRHMKKLFVAMLLFVLIIPIEASAVTHPVFGPKNLTLRTSAGTRHFSFFAGTALNDGNTLRQPIAAAGTISGLTVQVTTAPGSGNSYIATLMKNNVATTLTCTIANTNTSCTNSTNSVIVAAGDDLTWSAQTVGTTPSSQMTISATFEAYSVFDAAIGGTVAATNTDGFYGLVGGPASVTESQVSMVAPTSFVLDNLYCRVTSAPASTNSFAYTIYHNGSPTSLGCTITGVALTDQDTTDSVSVSAGDTLSIHFDATGAPTARIQNWGMRIRPTIVGEYPLMAVTTGIISTALPQYSSIWFAGAGATQEGSVHRESLLAFSWRKLYAFFDPAPGSGKSWAIVSRDNLADGNQSLTVANTSQSDQELVDSDSITSGEAIAIKTTPSGTPTTVVRSKFSSVAYVAPPTTRLLDSMVQPTFAFSLSRYLRGEEEGNPVVRLREDNGNTELDFKLDGSSDLVSNDVNEDAVSDWLTANSASNAYVSILYDQSGKRNHFTQATTTMQPQLVENSPLNGLAALYFNDVNHRLSTSTLDIAGAGGIEIHALLRPTSLGTTDSWIFGNGAVSLGAVYLDSSNWVWQADLAEELLSSTVPSINTDYLASFRYLTGFNHEIETNCSTVFSGANPSGEDPDWRTSFEDVIGNGSYNAADRSFKGYIGEMIVYNGVFTSGDLDEVQQSLATQGGVSGCGAASPSSSLQYRLYNLGQMLLNNGTLILR